MATLTGRAPKDTYGDLLQVSNANDGVDSTLRFLSDGKGTNSSFKISSSDAQFTSTLTSTGLLTTTAGIVSGSNIISDTDSTDDLGSTGVRWANLWVDNITMGGTIAGAVATFSSTLTVTGLTTIASLKGTGAVTITDILDEDNMASDSATVLATQQSIKAYVDAQVGTVDTLSEVLAIGNTSGANDLVMDSGQKITTNTIDETTAASGVTIDSVLVKDSTVTAGTLTIGAGSITDSSGAISFGNENLVTTGTLGCGALTSTGIDDNATSTQLTISDSASTFAGDVTIDGETLLVNSPSTATDVAAIHFNGSTTASSRYANISKMYDSPYTMKMQASNSAGESPLELWGSSDTMYLGFDISGNATFAGSISKASGSFKIPHPLPELNETHNLVHSFVESPRAENLYSGMVTLVDGTASVNIDTHSGMTEGTFEALNTLLTHSSSNEGGYSPVKCSVVGNVITINCQDATSTDKVYWEVRGERKDQHMLDTEWTDDEGHVIVEPLKDVVEAVVEEVVENV